MLRDDAGQPIRNIEQWPRPKREGQWKLGRSAMELAQSWLAGGSVTCPPELRAILDSHPLTRGTAFLEGCPEFVTPLPERGEGRNHDLWLRGRAPNAERLTICIEAKADESFGETVGNAINNARRQNANTGVQRRAARLLELITGDARDPEAAPWRDLRYQLVTATAGTVIQAQRDGSPTAVLIVQEFCGSHLDIELQRQNDADLQSFLRVVFRHPAELQAGTLAGPLQVSDDSPRPGVALLVGKIQCQIREGRTSTTEG